MLNKLLSTMERNIHKKTCTAAIYLLYKVNKTYFQIICLFYVIKDLNLQSRLLYFCYQQQWCVLVFTGISPTRDSKTPDYSQTTI